MKIFGNSLTARPTAAVVGTIFHDNSTNIDYVYDDGQWQVYPGGPIVPSEYVKVTDYATASKGGTVKVGDSMTIASGKINPKLGATLAAAADGAIGVVPAENQAASTASTVAATVADLNALLTKLKAAGLMAADPEEE